MVIKMKKDKRFEIVKCESVRFGQSMTIFRDKQTGVQYLYSQAGYGGGLTPLLDSEGKPIIDRRTY